jgi:hypothetical protein
MARTNITIGLDTSAAEASAGRLSDKIASVSEAMEEAKAKGRDAEYGVLAYEKEKLQAKSAFAAFERSSYSPPTNQQFQANSAKAQPSFKGDSDYNSLIRAQTGARGAIASLEEAIKKAETEDRYADAGVLYFQKDRMKSKTDAFERDAHKYADKLEAVDKNGQPVFKPDSEYTSLIRAQTEAIRDLTAQFETALHEGNLEAARGFSSKIGQRQDEFRRLVESPDGNNGQRGMAGAVNAIGFHQIAGAINEGFSRWAGSLSRSGIISQYGSGDVLGARISEMHRQNNLRSGLIQAFGGLAGGIVGGVATGGLGALAGATIGTQAATAIATALGISITQAENETTYAKLWDQKMGSAMKLAALSGDPNMVRDVFAEAARNAAQFGFSAEEGMEAMKQAALQGVNSDIVRQVFQHERSTGADRGTLSSVAALSARYGGGDALAAGWAGLQASGMGTGKYSEFLRAMQRVMEDGISRGFVRSSGEVTRNLTMLAKMTDNNPLWQGERGAQRLSEMNAGLEQSTALQTSSDAIAFRAARKIAGEDAHWVDVMTVLERGFSYEMLDKIMPLIKDIEGANNTGGIISQIKQIFGLNWTNARAIYTGWEPGLGEGVYHRIRQYENKPLPDASSAELAAAIGVNKNIKDLIVRGQESWDEIMPNILAELKGIREGSNRYVPAKESIDHWYSGFGNNRTWTEAQLRQSDLEGQMNVLSDFFSPGLNRRGLADNNAQRLITNTLRQAILSDDDAQFDKADEFVRLLNGIPQKNRESMDRDNTLNAMANYNMGQLLAAVREMTDAIKNTEVTINVP